MNMDRHICMLFSTSDCIVHKHSSKNYIELLIHDMWTAFFMTNEKGSEIGDPKGSNLKLKVSGIIVQWYVQSLHVSPKEKLN
jgi:hypothetical protein